MNKSRAIELFGGKVSALAEAIGITSQAISQWPEELPPRLADRVYAVWGKKNIPKLAPALVTPTQPATENVAQGV